MLRYVTFLLSGFTIMCIKILVGTIKGYMAAVNKHYRDNKFREPFDAKDDSDAAVLLRAQEKFEDAPAKRAPLTNQMIVKMCELAKQDPLGFHACVWDFVAIGRFGGFRQQEYAMDSKTEIKYYVKPDGTCVVRAFTVKNFIFYNTGDVILEKPLRNRVGVNKLGTQYDVQKNRMNGQIVCVVRLLDYPDYDPVDCGLNIVARASHLGFTDPDDPLCVYKKGDKVYYLTGEDITAYFRFIAKLVNPNISDAELKLIASHSLRVFAAVLLSEAGKDGPYIKLRLRWLSDCFEVYLRNTNRITEQHADALESVHAQMVALTLAATNMNTVVQVSGVIDLGMDDLEDED